MEHQQHFGEHWKWTAPDRLSTKTSKLYMKQWWIEEKIRNKSHEPHNKHTKHRHARKYAMIFVSSWMRTGYFWKYFVRLVHGGYGVSPRCAKA